MFRNQIILALSLTLGLAFILISCSDDGNNGSPTQTQNNPPVIRSVTANPSTIISYLGRTKLSCVATDPDGDSLRYFWSCPHGFFPDGLIGSSVEWYCSDVGDFHVLVTVNDDIDIDVDSVKVTVIQR